MTVGISPDNGPDKTVTLHLVDDDEAMFFNNNGQLIGKLYERDDGSRVYLTFRQEESHYMKKHNSYALDVSVFEDLNYQWPNVDEVCLFVTDAEEVYFIDLEEYGNAEEEQYPGFSPQLFPPKTLAHTVYEGVEFDGDYYPDTFEIS